MTSKSRGYGGGNELVRQEPSAKNALLTRLGAYTDPIYRQTAIVFVADSIAVCSYVRCPPFVHRELTHRHPTRAEGVGVTKSTNL
jgi:hypothetical protein